ncbi:MAG: delta-lactam-biosynthetic de-N-acetylase [Firmicutes bacterium HGW-Firmicutes-14]|nr:MAG: delta-lactam-biosynthetic de-N-acetylase [Firmicutes bacterium HGW-Firmicutes-14]
MKKFAAVIFLITILGISTVGGTHLAKFLMASNEEPSSPLAKDPISSPGSNSPIPGNGDEEKDGQTGGQVSDDPGDRTNTPGSQDSDSPGVVKDINNDLPPEQQDKTIFSWWFKRNPEHRPPEVETKAVETLKNKGVFLGKGSEKKVCLTFDEGYENGYTPRILDTLKNNAVPAAFFVTGDFAKKQPDLVKRMAAEGHIIGNHTTTHPSLPTITDREIRQEIKTTHDMVRDLTGVNMKFIRPPKGEYNSRVLTELNELGYSAVFWSMAYRDWEVDKQPGKEAALGHVMDNLHPGAVILLHAVSQSNTEALNDIIKGIRAEGYTFASLEELD